MDSSAIKVKTILDEQRISQAKLARKIGVTKATVCRWVKGDRCISPRSAAIIHEKFPEYSEEWLLGIDEKRREAERRALGFLNSFGDDIDGLLAELMLQAVACGGEFRFEQTNDDGTKLIAEVKQRAQR